MDLQLPELNGIEATRRILAANPQTRVLVLTMFDDDGTRCSRRCGPARWGYLVKGGQARRGRRAPSRPSRTGRPIFGPAIARRVIDFFAAGSCAPPLCHS